MTSRVVFLKSAEQDLKELRRYMIREFGAESWQASLAKIKDSVNAIGEFPLGGSVPDELECLNLTQYRRTIGDRPNAVHLTITGVQF